MSLLDRMKNKSDIDKDKLEEELKEASKRYYTDGTSALSDAEFDAKLDILKSIDPKNPLITSVSHGYDVEKDSTSGIKREHPYCIVGSLDKVHNWKELDKSLSNAKVICSLKLDGISCALYYTDGKLEYALTRGDGRTGIDITNKIKTIAPNMADVSFNSCKFTGAVRGELLMGLTEFEKFQSRHPGCKNQRNSVAGVINQKESDVDDLKSISLVVYSILAADDLGKYLITDHKSIFKALKNINDTAPWVECEKLSETSFDAYMRDCDDMFISSYDYPSDGIVIADNDITYSASDKTVVWNSQAYKFPSECKIATVECVEWNLSKTGYMVPKVKFNPIHLAGTEVAYATGFNAKYIKDNNIQRSCKIEVTKSGGIIPYIVKVDSSPDSDAVLPHVCPLCEEELQWDGVNLACKNIECAGQALWDLIVWIKTLAEVDGLSDALIEKFASVLNIKTVDDLYDISLDYAKNMIIEEGVAGKQSNLFISALSMCQTGSFGIDKAIKSCNIPRFGEKTSKACLGLEDVLLDCARLGFVPPDHEIYLRNHIGESNCDSLIINERKLQRLTFISDNIVKEDPCSVESKGDVCITGKLTMKRKDFEAMLRNAGYNPVSKVKKDTMFLITDNPESGSSKNKDADKFGVPKITEHRFSEMYL